MSQALPYSFESTVTYTGGIVTQVLLKAWSPTRDASRLRWELRRLYPYAQFQVDTPKTKICNQYNRDERLFVAICKLAAWPDQENDGNSGYALNYKSKRGGDEVDPESSDVEQEQWVSTQLMLRLLLGWQRSRRGKEVRDRITVNILQILHCMVPAEATVAVNLLATSDEERMLYREGCSDDGDI